MNSECVSLGISKQDLHPDKFLLYQNYPNPFNPKTVIGYYLPTNSHVNLTVYDMLGRKVIDLVNEKQTSGYKSEYWDGTNDYGTYVSGGVYIYKIKVANNVQIKKMILIK